MISEIPVLIGIATFTLVFASTFAGLAWWLSVQFKETRHTFYTAMDMRYAIISADYKERDAVIHKEVKELRDRLHAVEISNAARRPRQAT